MTLRGIDILLRGWQAIDIGVYAWLANPTLIVAVVALAMRKPLVACMLAALSSLLALSSFTAVGVAAGNGAVVPELSFLTGFYIWLATHFALFACSSAAAAARCPRGDPGLESNRD
jgi:hypothetical protein